MTKGNQQGADMKTLGVITKEDIETIMRETDVENQVEALMEEVRELRKIKGQTKNSYLHQQCDASLEILASKIVDIREGE